MKRLFFVVFLTYFLVTPLRADYDILVILQGDDDRVSANRLIEGSDGSLYGTNATGGNFGAGSIFRINKDGSGYQVLHSFSTDPNDGIKPLDRVVEGSDGVLYGTTSEGGQNALGTVFRINKDGSNYKILHSFSLGDVGVIPETALLEASDGALYGTTSQCGDGSFNSCNFDFFVGGPTIFKINKDGTGFANVLFLKSVRNPEDENQTILRTPTSSLVEGIDGYLYGNAGPLFKVKKDGSNVSLDISTGAVGELLLYDGYLYSIAMGIGTAGEIVKINQDFNNFTKLRSFVNTGNVPSYLFTGPFVGLVLDQEKDILYGVANSMAYKLNTDGTGYEILEATRYKESYGVLSTSPRIPILASDGDLYGSLGSHAGCGVEVIPGIYSLKNSVETILNWAEVQFPQYFPQKQLTQSFGPWQYRYYPSTGIYAGINNDDNGVYVLGGEFGQTPLFVDTKKTILNQALGAHVTLCENN